MIEVESSLGAGASFHVYLPLIEEKKLNENINRVKKVISGNGELILIVDDDKNIRDISSEVLNSLGYQTMVAADGLEAVDIFLANKNSISLVIMDAVMPKLSGVLAAERIKKACPKVKIIFATGYNEDESLKKEMPTDNSVVLSKPYDMSILSEAIVKQLKS